MKVIIFIIFLLFYNITYAKEIKLNFQYNFESYVDLKNKFPFLIDTKETSFYRDFDWQKDFKYQIYLYEFKYNNSLYYLIIDTNFCGSGGCKIEIFSRKSNKIILSKYIGFMDLYINNSKLLFKDMNNNIVFEFEIRE